MAQDYRYDENAGSAANRHFHDAKKLEEDHRYDNAGYHYGFAAECAVKHALIQTGILKGDPIIRKLHFPELRGNAVLALQGRTSRGLLNLLQPSFMQHWDVAMRYSSSGMIDREKAEKWRIDANKAIGLMLF
ncbi:HEPN domain-containing protein [Methylomagnum ishizawai]|uniref:HEPN domain-containing protein n=1 Tax=Methylomagnum ishizawai TaxID=1760988 RepID=A0A1Y6CT30_9GAMM|nr:HEPN domain-containing protein [Methylomagnum ishizawai]SMF93457.1 HEPN domain-containing protein [Methylomagnum ishizawai]